MHVPWASFLHWLTTTVHKNHRHDLPTPNRNETWRQAEIHRIHFRKRTVHGYFCGWDVIVGTWYMHKRNQRSSCQGYASVICFTPFIHGFMQVLAGVSLNVFGVHIAAVRKKFHSFSAENITFSTVHLWHAIFLLEDAKSRELTPDGQNYSTMGINRCVRTCQEKLCPFVSKIWIQCRWVMRREQQPHNDQVLIKRPKKINISQFLFTQHVQKILLT